MGFEVKVEYFSLYYEDGTYEKLYSELMGEKTRKNIERILYSLNKQSMEQCSSENYKQCINNNFFFWGMEDCIVLFKTRPRTRGILFINEIEGLVFPKESIKTVWYLLDKLILFLFSAEFYDLCGSPVLKESFLKQMEKRYSMMKDKKVEFEEVLEMVRTSVKPFSFAYTGWELETENVRIFFNGTEKNLKNVKKEDIIDRMLVEEKKESLKSSIKLGYELPNRKRMNSNENFWEKSKAILKQKKEGTVFWYLKTEDGTIPLHISGKGDRISFEEVKKWCQT